MRRLRRSRKTARSEHGESNFLIAVSECIFDLSIEPRFGRLGPRERRRLHRQQAALGW